MDRTSGFSLLEMLMVIFFIAVLAAIAVPNMLAAKIAANEASAIASLKSFLKANYDYKSATGSFGTPRQLRDAGYIDEQLGSPMEKCGKTIYIKHGYALTMVPTKLERRLNSGGGSTGNGGGSTGSSGKGGGKGNAGGTGAANGAGNNVDDGIIITEYYMDAIPCSSYEPTLYRTGVRWFYIDSISNTPWIIKNTKPGNPCSPGVVCFDLSKSKPRYEVCTALN